MAYHLVADYLSLELATKLTDHVGVDVTVRKSETAANAENIDPVTMKDGAGGSDSVR